MCLKDFYAENEILTRATLSQYTPITEAFDRDVGIIDMHIGDMLWAISGKYLV
jgi:hypothetical protein